MFNSGKLKKLFVRQKKINILTFVLSEKKILNETKNHSPPLQVKWSVPKETLLRNYYFIFTENKHLVFNTVIFLR